MTVKELKELLKDVDDNRIVIMQADSEGNGYSPLAGIDDESVYLADSTWSGDVGYKKLTPRLKKEGYTQEDMLEDGEDALILFPIS